MQNTYAFGKAVSTNFETTIQQVTEELQKEGFGILSDIDVAATLKKKLDLDMPGYRILGACNPPFAHRVIEAEPTIGVLLPCNVIVREETTGNVMVEFMDPQAILQMTDNSEVHEVAGIIRQKMLNVMNAIK